MAGEQFPNDWADWAGQPKKIRQVEGPTAMDMLTLPSGPTQDDPRLDDDRLEVAEAVVGPGTAADLSAEQEGPAVDEENAPYYGA